MDAMEIAKAAVEGIIEDMTGRRYYNDNWYKTEPDIQDEIREAWECIVAGVITMAEEDL